MSSILFYNWRKMLLFQRKLDGYNFPVYSTKHCPRNQTEWNQRSSAIHCSKDNGYVCLPNENITGLLEFCHTYKFILIEEGNHHKVSYRIHIRCKCVEKICKITSNLMFRHFRMNFWHNCSLKIIHHCRYLHFFSNIMFTSSKFYI